MSVLKKYVSRRQLTPADVDAIEDKLRRALHGRVEKAYLFGSVATGDFQPTSDIDLILIKDSILPFATRGTEFLDLFEIYPDLDILVYSDVEFERQLATPGPGFWRSVQRSMRPLF